MLHITYTQKLDEAGVPVFDALAGFIMVTGRATADGWQLPNKRMAISELTAEQSAVYSALAESLTSRGESWVARGVSVEARYMMVEVDGEWKRDGIEALELTIYAVQDGTGATRTFTSKDNESLRVSEETVINLYNELHE